MTIIEKTTRTLNRIGLLFGVKQHINTIKDVKRK